MDVRKEVIKKLDSIFPDIEIYGEEIKQGFKEPCFFVTQINTDHKQELGRRYKRTHSFDVQYFGTSNQGMENMALMLYEDLEYLLDYKARAKSMNHQVAGGVLHFFVDYTVMLVKEEEAYPKMEYLEVNNHGKE